MTKISAPPGNRTRVARMGILHDTITPAALTVVSRINALKRCLNLTSWPHSKTRLIMMLHCCFCVAMHAKRQHNAECRKYCILYDLNSCGFSSTMNRSNLAMDDERVGRNLPSICRPMAWERRRPYSANSPLDDEPRTRPYQQGRHVAQRSRDDLFYQRPHVDSTGQLFEVYIA